MTGARSKFVGDLSLYQTPSLMLKSAKTRQWLQPVYLAKSTLTFDWRSGVDDEDHANNPLVETVSFWSYSIYASHCKDEGVRR